jgi:hypothetical protein
MRSGQTAKVRALPDRRLRLRPLPHDTRWRGLITA